MTLTLTDAETETALNKIGGEPGHWGSYGRVRQKRGMQRFGASIKTPYGYVNLTGEADWHNHNRGWCRASGKKAAIEWATE